MNQEILEGIEAYVQIGDTMEREMLPGNHKDKFPLICFATHPPTPFFVLGICIVNPHLFLSFSVCSYLPSFRGFCSNCFEAGALHSSLARNLLFLEPAPMLKGLYYLGKLGQCADAHFPGTYLVISCNTNLQY